MYTLSIAPSLELKLGEDTEGEDDYILSIAPSLELKHNIQHGYHAGARYQSHHLWNWNRFNFCFRNFAWFLSIAPSLELKRSLSFCTARSSEPYQSHHLWNWNYCSTMLTDEQLSSINRTIFGIETWQRRFHRQWSRFYQSHHLWNWNATASRCWPWKIAAINRTIFGIETFFWRIVLEDVTLSIAPSLELKRGCQAPVSLQYLLSIAPSLELKRFPGGKPRRRRRYYQSHHLWNWNVWVGWCDGYALPLSIAPSLELKPFRWQNALWKLLIYQSHHLWNWNGLFPHVHQYGHLYQSHHLWNWNTYAFDCHTQTGRLSIAPSLELKQSLAICTKFPLLTINRTIFGIETGWRRMADMRWILSIAPSLELKPQLSLWG